MNQVNAISFGMIAISSILPLNDQVIMPEKLNFINIVNEDSESNFFNIYGNVSETNSTVNILKIGNTDSSYDGGKDIMANYAEKVELQAHKDVVQKDIEIIKNLNLEVLKKLEKIENEMITKEYLKLVQENIELKIERSSTNTKNWLLGLTLTSVVGAIAFVIVNFQAILSFFS